MRRLPGPADCRLSEGDHTPEALYELFRDWQRTQTQSSVTALQGPRQQMDVWFCRAQEPMPGGIRCALSILEVMTRTLSRACPGHPCLRLTDDLHGGRQYGYFDPVPRNFWIVGNSENNPAKSTLRTRRLSSRKTGFL
jgi:hypothetical protein